MSVATLSSSDEDHWVSWNQSQLGAFIILWSYFNISFSFFCNLTIFHYLIQCSYLLEKYISITLMEYFKVPCPGHRIFFNTSENPKTIGHYSKNSQTVKWNVKEYSSLTITTDVYCKLTKLIVTMQVKLEHNTHNCRKATLLRYLNQRVH